MLAFVWILKKGKKKKRNKIRGRYLIRQIAPSNNHKLILQQFLISFR